MKTSMKRVWMLLVLLSLFDLSGMANANLSTIGTATYGNQNYSLIYEDDQGWYGWTIPTVILIGKVRWSGPSD